MTSASNRAIITMYSVTAAARAVVFYPGEKQDVKAIFEYGNAFINPGGGLAVYSIITCRTTGSGGNAARQGSYTAGSTFTP